MTARGVSAIVLAGGRSDRFGSDKLNAPLEGISLLQRAVSAVATQADEVIVVLAPGDERPLPVAAVPVRRAMDPAAHGGPLVGLLAGLEVADQPLALVVGGDMPALVPEVLGALVGALVAAGDGTEAVALVQRGAVRPLPMVLRNGSATPQAARLLGQGERSLVALLGSLQVRRLTEPEWRSLDPEARTLLDVDRPGDLPTDPT
jgi:molybdopterin-guanine dinucleotide biosynthesis protein A